MHQSWTCLSLSLSLDFSPSNFPTTFICRHRGSGCGCRRNKSQYSAFPFSNGFHVRPRIWGRRKVGKGKIKPLFLFKVRHQSSLLLPFIIDPLHSQMGFFYFFTHVILLFHFLLKFSEMSWINLVLLSKSSSSFFFSFLKVFGNLCDHYHRTNSGDSSASPGKSCGGNAYWANGS